MAALGKRNVVIVGRSIGGVCGILLATVLGGGVRAQTPAAKASSDPTSDQAPAGALPGKLAALLPKARQLQQDGDLRTAQQVARFDLKHHTDQAQLAGCLEVLTSIDKQSGRYEEALATGTRYRQLLEKIPNADASKRQDIALMLAEILASLERYPQAITHVDDALAVADGWRTSDVLWEPHAHALRAQIERAAGEIDAADADWRKVELRMRSILDRISQTGPNAELEGAALKLLTEAMVSSDRTPEAITIREQYLARQQDDLVRARNWSEIANCYVLLAQDDKAEHALREALALETRHEEKRPSVEQADLLDRLALVLEHRGELAEARRQWKEAAAIYQQLAERRTGRRHHWERQLGYLAKLQVVFERLNQWQDAIDAGQQLFTLRSQTLLPDDPRLWRIKSTLGSLYARTSDREKARSLLTEALEYWRSRVPTAVGELAPTLTQLSKLSLAEGDHARALEYAQQAVTFCQQAPPGHELQLAEAYDSQGDALAASGRPQDAIDHYRQAVKICRARPDDRRANVLLCGSLVDIANVYKSQHQYRRAAEYCAHALDARQRAPGKDPLALVGLYTALATLQMADDQSGKGDAAELAKAEANIAAARQLCTEQGWLEGPAGIGVLELEAAVDVRHQKLDAARKSLDQALVLSRRSQLTGLEAKILTQLAGLEKHRSPSAAGSPPKP